MNIFFDCLESTLNSNHLYFIQELKKFTLCKYDSLNELYLAINLFLLMGVNKAKISIGLINQNEAYFAKICRLFLIIRSSLECNITKPTMKEPYWHIKKKHFNECMSNLTNNKIQLAIEVITKEKKWQNQI